MLSIELWNILLADPRDITETESTTLEAAAVTERASKYIAQHLYQRTAFLTEIDNGIQIDDETIWDRLRTFWEFLSYIFDPSIQEYSLTAVECNVALALGLGRLQRNLIAGVYRWQECAIDSEPAIRKLLFHITTFTRIEGPLFFPLQIVLTQLLSNLLSPTSLGVGERFVDTHLTLYQSGKRDDDVIIRLLDSRDVGVNLVTLHFVANLTRRSRRRFGTLWEGVGLSWTSKILARLDDWLILHDGRFDVAYTLFRPIFEFSLQQHAYTSLASPPEPITPSQTVLLKLIDHYLSSPHPNRSPSPHCYFIDLYKNLSEYSLASLQSGKDDARLPKVFEGLILVLEGLCSIGLACQERSDRRKSGNQQVQDKEGGEEELIGLLRKNETGVIRLLIELLKQLETFLPRRKHSSQQTDTTKLNEEQIRPITLLKRNLVRLVGILTFESIQTSDLVREYGGVHLLLSMTEVDELNPYLREHALFAVRNLMFHNPQNQQIIQQMNPVGVLGPNGELLPVPGKLQRTDDERHQI
ncbi:hypothetical protein M231_01611 [Tremella mesenterica]|uniref:Ataxin-10 homolog n=1 Tax=Tremella mesenterica TaxID=5217 RepID=A0A4Q1BT76_TREME|nr:uncharacterized protein TREMEDRAFT_64548 [Tremella mesenterica DSM 1558]EIW67301.1 hypothetical protein TREMEDRAFT_64548 [Tremella mesenterica DSM 1558]RXK41206.1 hypothetical protein M231_01611 [Tremella mesenterica]